MSVSSAGVATSASSEVGSTRRIRVMPFATHCSAPAIGRATYRYAAMGRAKTSNVRSGPISARFFGTISPNTMCSTVTIPSPMPNPMVCSTASGISTIPCTACSMSRAIAGSVRRPTASEHSVIPNCAPPRVVSTSDCIRCAARAERFPVAAWPSTTARFAPMRPNSTATNAPLNTMSTRPTAMANAVMARRHPHRRRRLRSGRGR